MELSKDYLEEAALKVAPVGERLSVGETRFRVKEVVEAAFYKGYYDIPSVVELGEQRKILSQKLQEADKKNREGEERLRSIDRFIAAVQQWEDWIDGRAPLEEHKKRWEILRDALRELGKKAQ